MRHINKHVEIGEKLKNARLSCGLTQDEVSEQIDCAPRYIGQLETNRTTGSISVILELCNLYGITLNDLYSDYLNEERNDITSISGFFKLNDDHKSIIINSISYMNKLESKN